jgi:hypothetical protein
MTDQTMKRADDYVLVNGPTVNHIARLIWTKESHWGLHQTAEALCGYYTTDHARIDNVEWQDRKTCKRCLNATGCDGIECGIRRADRQEWKQLCAASDGPR